ncbi:MAG: DegT/DnrJ/EryC1/StrS family aminotransferase [Planctomycetes bacterium]|nr:DegT/DnrJ/EryC1/StrS family aminotransferase [Planctomycetota bacterium]
MSAEGPRIPHSRPTVFPGLADAVARVVDSGQHAGGSVRRAFEEELARRIGVRHAVAVQSGSAALHLALLTLDVRPGRAVLLPSYACMAVLNAVTSCDARPVLVDVHPTRLNIDAERCRAALRRESLSVADVSAIIAPHMIGLPAPMPELRDLGPPVIEDCAMGLGAEIDGEEVGAWGTVSIFSFYATKMISTGQGGMLLTANDRLAARARDLIQYDNRETRRETTWNYPLPDLAAALGRPQLEHLDQFLERRARIATRYLDFAQRRSIRTPECVPESRPNHFRFVFLLEDRDLVRAALERDGIESKPPVFRPLHRYLDLRIEDFEGAEAAYDAALSVPIYPSLTDLECDRVLDALDRAL